MNLKEIRQNSELPLSLPSWHQSAITIQLSTPPSSNIITSLKHNDNVMLGAKNSLDFFPNQLRLLTTRRISISTEADLRHHFLTITPCAHCASTLVRYSLRDIAGHGCRRSTSIVGRVTIALSNLGSG